MKPRKRSKKPLRRTVFPVLEQLERKESPTQILSSAGLGLSGGAGAAHRSASGDHATAASSVRDSSTDAMRIVNPSLPTGDNDQPAWRDSTPRPAPQQQDAPPEQKPKP